MYGTIERDISRIHSAKTEPELKALYESLIEKHARDYGILWAIRDAAYYAKCRLNGIDPDA